jgi:hypothetical protein
MRFPSGESLRRKSRTCQLRLAVWENYETQLEILRGRHKTKNDGEDGVNSGDAPLHSCS